MTTPVWSDRLPDPETIRRVPPAVLVPGAWLAIGLILGVCQYLALRLAGSTVSFLGALEGPLLGTFLWIPLTALAIRAGARPIAGKRSVATVALLAVLSSVLLNAAFQLVHQLVPGGSPNWGRVLPDAILFLPFNGAAFLAIVFVTRWWLRPARSAPLDAASRTLEVRDGTGLMRLPAEEITWIEARGDYVRLHTGRGAYLVARRMDDLAGSLAAAGFVRIHRSAIVNVRRVRQLHPRGHGDGQVVLQDGTPLRVARGRRQGLASALERLADR